MIWHNGGMYYIDTNGEMNHQSVVSTMLLSQIWFRQWQKRGIVQTWVGWCLLFVGNAWLKYDAVMADIFALAS